MIKCYFELFMKIVSIILWLESESFVHGFLLTIQFSVAHLNFSKIVSAFLNVLGYGSDVVLRGSCDLHQSRSTLE